jgi:hypothetical protein
MYKIDPDIAKKLPPNYLPIYLEDVHPKLLHIVTDIPEDERTIKEKMKVIFSKVGRCAEFTKHNFPSLYEINEKESDKRTLNEKLQLHAFQVLRAPCREHFNTLSKKYLESAIIKKQKEEQEAEKEFEKRIKNKEEFIKSLEQKKRDVEIFSPRRMSGFPEDISAYMTSPQSAGTRKRRKTSKKRKTSSRKKKTPVKKRKRKVTKKKKSPKRKRTTKRRKSVK